MVEREVTPKAPHVSVISTNWRIVDYRFV